MRRKTTAALLLVLSAVALPSGVFAQKKGDRVRVLAGSAMRTAPGGSVVGVLSRAFDAPVEMVQGGAVRLRLSGFVSEQDVRLEANRARGIVGGAASRGDAGTIVRLGGSEKDAALATIQRGSVVFLAEKAGTFLAMNRAVWVDKSRLTKFTTAETAKPGAKPNSQAAQQPAPALPASKPATSGQPAAVTPAAPPLATTASTALLAGPNGNSVATLPAGTLVIPMGSENGFTRVRLDGWIATKDLADAGARAAGNLSAADLRADPEGTKGKIVRWTVEALSYQVADGLRRELNGEPYLLARGPGNERAILYLAVPDSLVSAARALAPLTTVTVTARVRSGRSQPGGVPILDLIELLRR